MNFYPLIPLIAGFLGFLVAFFMSGNVDLFVIAYSFLIVIPVAGIALYVDKYDIFSPLKILTYILIISSPLFSVYIYFFANQWKAGYGVFWQPFADLTLGINLIAFASFAIITGYFIGQKKLKFKDDEQPHSYYSKKKIQLASIGVLLIAIFADLMFASDVNYSASLADNVLSRKTIHEATVGMSVRGSALTHWRLLGISLPHGLMIVYCMLMWLGKIRTSKSDYVFIGLLFLVSSFIPFIASSRTPILEILVILAMIRHYVIKRMILGKLLIFGFVGMMVIGTLGELRRNPGSLNLSTIESSLDSVIGSSYFVDLGKTAIVVNRVPDSVDYLYGSSLASIILAVIPRQLWPEKPVVRIGYFVGQEIIGLNNQTGIPPGFIAEMYLNFGYWGIFPAFFLVGFIMVFYYEKMKFKRNFENTVGYVLGIVIISLSLLATDLTYALIQTISYLFPIYTISKFVKYEPSERGKRGRTKSLKPKSVY